MNPAEAEAIWRWEHQKHLLTTELAALAVFVEPTVVRQWKRRGLLVPADHDERGRPLYRHADVLDVERRTRTRVRKLTLLASSVTLIRADDPCPKTI